MVILVSTLVIIRNVYSEIYVLYTVVLLVAVKETAKNAGGMIRVL